MRPALLLLLFCLKALPDAAQARQISGVVLDGQTADVLHGVSVCRDTCFAETDTNGRFTVNAPSGEVNLGFQCAGYKTGHQALLPAQDFITVFLQPELSARKREAERNRVPDSAGGGLKGPVPVAVTALEAETYQRINENPFEEAAAFPFSSFILSGDQVSYCNVRRFLNGDRLPPKEAVRVGEMMNYLPAESPADTTFPGSMGLQARLITCPWNRSHWLLALKAETREMRADILPPRNLVLLIDISGSMSAPRKLALLKKAFDVLAGRLSASDRISVIVYSGNATLVLPPTPGDRKAEIKSLINNLSAGGSTAGTAGIEMAFQVARRNFIPGGDNRVIMATDGDFNVGESSDGAMRKLISRYHGWGIRLTCIGVGTGNYKDSKLETLARWGQGNFIYLDDPEEAARVFAGDSFARILATCVGDASIRAVFNPEMIRSYRLIGYEPQRYGSGGRQSSLPGGSIGYGQQLNVFYELVPAPRLASHAGPMATVVLRYRDASHPAAHILVRNVVPDVTDYRKSSQDLQLRTAVALFGMLLRNSDYKGSGGYRTVEKMIQHLKGKPYRQENKAFLKLVQKARRLSAQP